MTIPINKEYYMKIKDISVEQYVKLITIEKIFAEDTPRMLNEIAKLFSDGEDMRVKDMEIFYMDLKTRLTAKPIMQNRFVFEGIEWGFISNLADIKTGEYIDITEYSKDPTTYHKMLAVMYRPVEKSYKQLYEIEKYENAQKYADVMKRIPVEILLGAFDFFFHLLEDLLSDLDTYSKKMMVKLTTQK